MEVPVESSVVDPVLIAMPDTAVECLQLHLLLFEKTERVFLAQAFACEFFP